MDSVELKRQVNVAIQAYLQEIRDNELEMLRMLKSGLWETKSDISNEARSREDVIVRIKELEWILQLIDRK